MPTYDYLCESCGDAFEHVQTMKSGKLRKCKKCKSFGLVRLIGSGGAVLFKGDPGNSGFHSLDYERNNGIYDIDRQRERVREGEIKRGER